MIKEICPGDSVQYTPLSTDDVVEYIEQYKNRIELELSLPPDMRADNIIAILWTAGYALSKDYQFSVGIELEKKPTKKLATLVVLNHKILKDKVVREFLLEYMI